MATEKKAAYCINCIDPAGDVVTLCTLHAAAQDLLEALERWINPHVGCHCDRTAHPSGKCAACVSRAAVAKARGEA